MALGDSCDATLIRGCDLGAKDLTFVGVSCFQLAANVQVKWGIGVSAQVACGAQIHPLG